MSTIRFLPEEVEALSAPVMALESALAGIREKLEEGDTQLAISYLELAEGAVASINTIHERMAEPVEMASA